MQRWRFAAIPRWRLNGEVPCTLRRVAMRTCHLGVVQSSVSAARSGYGVIDLRGHTFTPAKDTDLQRVLGLGRIANRLREGFASSLATGSPGLDRGRYPLCGIESLRNQPIARKQHIVERALLPAKLGLCSQGFLINQFDAAGLEQP